MCFIHLKLTLCSILVEFTYVSELFVHVITTGLMVHKSYGDKRKKGREGERELYYIRDVYDFTVEYYRKKGRACVHAHTYLTATAVASFRNGDNMSAEVSKRDSARVTRF